MLMKTSVGRLYMLFNACLPDNKQVQKRFIISKILESKEYTELKDYKPFKKQFEQCFSKDKLSYYDVDKLNEITKAIPKIIPTIEKIENAINYGNAMDLTEKDIPDFCSVKSLDNLLGKLEINQSNQNITNITKDNFQDIFSAETVKDPTETLRAITVDDIKNPVDAVRKNLVQSVYCIKAEDIGAIQDEYTVKMSAIREKQEGLKKIKKSIRFKKLMFIGIVIILLVIISTFELLSSSNFDSLMSLSVLLMLIYFIVG